MSKEKSMGDRYERKTVSALLDIGVAARRTLLSAQAGRHEGADVAAQVPGYGPLQIEVKSRTGARGWAGLKKWIEHKDLLVLCEPNKDPLVVMPWWVFKGFVVSLRPKDSFNFSEAIDRAPVRCEPGHTEEE